MGKDGTELAFLVMYTRPLKSLRFTKGKKLLIDGPYGQDLKLKYFKSAMLAAHRLGIVGVLSIARSLWEHRRPDDMLQSEYLLEPRPKLTRRELFVVWRVYPSEENETPAFEERSHWLYFHKFDRDILLEHMMDATPEKTCSDPDFSAGVRKAVIDRRATRPIEFTELQYRASARPSRATADLEKETGQHSTTDDVDLEKGKDKAHRMRPEEDEEWDEMTLYSPTGTLADNTSQKKTYQKKTD
ncbi:hypothetical protein F5X98DRAFT_385325 [Xylaria grammica]|nr:hypothetical protein F5X98DRAFT_385325 [Xylaria grammica]